MGEWKPPKDFPLPVRIVKITDFYFIINRFREREKSLQDIRFCKNDPFNPSPKSTEVVLHLRPHFFKAFLFNLIYIILGY